MNWTTIVPIVAALVAGLGGFVGGPVLAGWFARREHRAAVAVEQDRVLAAAKLSADESDRVRISKDYQWTIDDLRREVTNLYARQAEQRTQLEALQAELATVRQANTALRIENDQLKAQLRSETAKHEVLKRRVDNLDAERILMLRELARLGVSWQRHRDGGGGTA